MTDLVLVVCAGLAVLVGSGALLLAARSRAESVRLRARLEELERREPVAAPSVVPVVEEPAPLAAEPAPLVAEPVEVTATLPPRLPAPVFTDMVVRESVIRLASLTHGVRRALSPAQRNRIRFEIRAETRRSRKQRRGEQRAALRRMQAREREAA